MSTHPKASAKQKQLSSHSGNAPASLSHSGAIDVYLTATRLYCKVIEHERERAKQPPKPPSSVLQNAILTVRRAVRLAIRPRRTSGASGTTYTRQPLPERERYDSIVMCASYPGREIRGGEFLRSRFNAYLEAGHTPLVIEVSRRNKITTLEADDIECLRTHPNKVGSYIGQLCHRAPIILCHAPRPEVVDEVLKIADTTPAAFWFHGADVRDFRRLYFNHPTESMERKRQLRSHANRQRLAMAAKCFADARVRNIFVSDYIKTIAEIDCAQKVVNSEIIHNFIDGSFYCFKPKSSELFKRILLIRSFEHENYANDIAVEAICILSERPGFDQLQFTVSGFGALFAPLTARVAGLANVTISPGHKTPEQMRDLHGRHGLFLAPSRHDTQGVTLGEAMASGLACITNRVAAIPEFADDACATLVRPNDPQAYADAIWQMTHDPKLAQSKAKAAGERVRAQCGFDETVAKELELIAALSSAKRKCPR